MQLIRAQDWIALHCKDRYVPTFEHGTHRSRIDFVFVCQHQVQYRRMQPTIDRVFERNFGHLGPRHHPLFVVIPKWYAPRKPVFPPNYIDRFALRQARLDNTSHWQRFEARVRVCIQHHCTHPDHDIQANARLMETAIRNLCIDFFPKRKIQVSDPTHVPSISARMWNARRQILATKGHGLRDLFLCWRHLTQFHVLHKAVRKQSRLNKRANSIGSFPT